ncbi:MAG: hypothetical protein M3R08_11425, partial [Bacteroidota bacterium]|nr:hypothetical protein [Bacteroidota bacterium]
MRSSIYQAISVMALMAGAIWNGYPIVYSDTSSYLGSGFEMETLVDRPITYGIFILITSLHGATLWTTIAAQCLLLGIVLRSFLAQLHVRSDQVKLVIVALISMLTGLTFVTGQLMADVFTPIMLLSCFLAITSPAINSIAMFAIYTVAFAMHMSHIPIMLIVLFLITIYFFFTNKKTLRTRILPIILLSLIATIPMGVSISKSSHVFFMARMAENGILQEFLQENCADGHYRLCQAENIPQDANAFMWAPKGPLTLYANWADAGSEFNQIISGSLGSRKYLMLHAQALFRSTAMQLGSFAIADGTGAFGQGTLLHQRLSRYVPNELEQYEKSRQFQGKLNTEDLEILVMIHQIILLLSVAVLVIYLIIAKIRRDFFTGNIRAVIY